jgi:hypothetical protein
VRASLCGKNNVTLQSLRQTMHNAPHTLPTPKPQLSHTCNHLQRLQETQKIAEIAALKCRPQADSGCIPAPHELNNSIALLARQVRPLNESV